MLYYIILYYTIFKLYYMRALPSLERRFWKDREAPEAARKYADVEVGSRHLVMAYVPSKKVAEMTQKKLTNTDEFKRQQKAES